MFKFTKARSTLENAPRRESSSSVQPMYSDTLGIDDRRMELSEVASRVSTRIEEYCGCCESSIQDLLISFGITSQSEKQVSIQTSNDRHSLST